MSTKAAAVLMAMLMVSASVLCVSNDSRGAGTYDSPVMISGDNDEYRVLNVDDSSNVSMTSYFSINWNSFLNPKVTIQSWTCDSLADFIGSDPDESSMVTLMSSNVSASGCDYGNNISASVSAVSGSSGFNGVYAITLTASDAADLCYYKIKVIVEENVGSVRDSQSYYYGIHMKAVTGELYSVMVQDADGDYKNSITFDRDTPYQAAVKIAEESFDSDGYYFYAIGLPNGINMRLDGIIEGKTAGYLVATEGDATIYAINKYDLSEVHSGALHYVLLPSDSFEYLISGAVSQTVSCFDEGYATIGNTQTLTFNIIELNGNTFDKSRYAAKLVLNDATGVSLEVSDSGAIVLNSDLALQDYTGIVQMHISKSVSGQSDLETTIHIMVVGPVVHTGLSPSITSA